VNEQESPGMWVRARQFSGRIVTVTNDKVFDEPVYNFTSDLPFIWEEITVPVPYQADRARAERILLTAAQASTDQHARMSEPSRAAFASKFGVALDQPEPRVYWRLTDNWLELTVRFLVPEHGVREIKDTISRRILSEFDDAAIEVASATFGIVQLPPVRVKRESMREQRP
jgi:small-conductance mechanosensitive channel